MVSSRQTRFSNPPLDHGNSCLAPPIPSEHGDPGSTIEEKRTIPIPAQLVEELAQLLADILVEDFQQHRRATVGSLSRTDRNPELKLLRGQR